MERKSAFKLALSLVVAAVAAYFSIKSPVSKLPEQAPRDKEPAGDSVDARTLDAAAEYIVQPGDNTWTIATEHFGLQPWQVHAFEEYNFTGSKDPGVIYAGDVLYMPPQSFFDNYAGLSAQNTSTLDDLMAAHDLIINISYYNPLRGGKNCLDDCRYTGNATQVVSDDGSVPVGSYWWNSGQNFGGAACPSILYGKTLGIIIDDENSEAREQILLECIDAGGQINIKENSDGSYTVRVDILHNDNLKRDDPENVYNGPLTAGGIRIDTSQDGRKYLGWIEQ